MFLSLSIMCLVLLRCGEGLDRGGCKKNQFSISAVNPSAATFKDGTDLTLTGCGFSSNSSVAIGALACAVTSQSSNQIVCSTPRLINDQAFVGQVWDFPANYAVTAQGTIQTETALFAWPPFPPPTPFAALLARHHLARPSHPLEHTVPHPIRKRSWAKNKCQCAATKGSARCGGGGC